MTWTEVQKVLEKYDIHTVDDLEYCLGVMQENDECIDDPKDKNCMNAKCYEGLFVPDCRKVVEIYIKYFKDDIKSKKLFITYLTDKLQKGKSSIENYMSCKSCNQQMAKENFHNLKIGDSDFKRDFCNNLTKKFDYTSLFCTDYESIGQFLKKEHEVTQDSFQPFIKEEKMTQDEKIKLFKLIHTSKEEVKANLKKIESIEGSYIYQINLAKSLFERGLIDESLSVVKTLESHKDFVKNEEFLQLKAKILSSKQMDKEAISILKDLVEAQKPLINPETNNLLAASIKRLAFSEFSMYDNQEELFKQLNIAKDIYLSIYQLTRDYYPALNYMYLVKMLAVVNSEDKQSIKKSHREFSVIWSSIEHKITDWWSFIAEVEYLVLVNNFSEAKDKLISHFDELDEIEISDFNLLSTIRQLELYNNFIDSNDISEIVDFLKKHSN